MQRGFDAARSVPDVGAVVSDAGREAAQATAGSLLLCGADASALALVVHAGLEVDDVDGFRRIDVGGDLPAARVVAEARPLFVSSNAAYARCWPDLASQRQALGLEAEAITPLSCKVGVLGALIFDYDQPKAFDAAERGMLTAVTSGCAQALLRLVTPPEGVTGPGCVHFEEGPAPWLRRRVLELDALLERQRTIERAKGILMERHAVDERAAFELLRQTARSRTRPVVAVAVAVAVCGAHSPLPRTPDKRDAQT